MRVRTRLTAILASVGALALLWPASGAAASASAGQQYALVRLALPPGWSSGEALGVNGSGQVAGAVLASNTTSQPALWLTPRDVQLLRLPKGAIGGVATDINDAGDIVGYARKPDGSDHAVVWTGRKARWLPETTGAVQGVAQSINRVGDVVGFESRIDGEHATFWSHTTIPPARKAPITGPLGTTAFDINNSMLTAGAQAIPLAGPITAFTWMPGQQPTTLQSALPDQDAFAEALNDDGLVVGFAITDQGTQAVSWGSGQLSVLPLPAGKAHSQAWDVNSSGTVVGRASSEGNDAIVPVLWSPAGAQQLPALGDQPWQWTDTAAINDAGMVIGTYEDISSPDLQFLPLAWIPQ